MAPRDITATIVEIQIQNPCTNVKYPQVKLNNYLVEAHINDLIKEQVFYLIPGEGCDVYEEIFGTYKISVNRSSILSVVLDVYTFRWHAANGLDVQKSVTANLQNGEAYYFYNLFKPDSDYKAVIDAIILKQIEEQQLPLLTPFPGVTDDQEYYLTDKALVVYYQEIQFTPHYVGIPEFTIPYAEIEPIVKKDGPIGKLMR